jgi:hypothetical protein
MPRRYVPKTDRKNNSHKVQSLPEKFRAGFLAALDGRTDLAKALRANYEQIVADVGGREDVGHVKSSLIERFCWLEAILQALETDMAKGAIDKAEALGKWIQAVNSLSGLAKVLGVDRKAKSMPWMTVPNTPAPEALRNGLKELPTEAAP